MKLYEYEAKEIARKYGLPVPDGYPASTPEEAFGIAKKLNCEVAIKSQVLVGRRGLAGGIKFAKTPGEAREIAAKLLGSLIRGVPVEKVLVERKACISREYYLSLTVDRSTRSIALLASTLGGVEIEELVKEHPEALMRINIDPSIGVKPYMARWIAEFFGLGKDFWGKLRNFIDSMWRIMKDLDAELVEFNPLVLTCDNDLLAVDAKIIIDDNSLYRHKEFLEKAFREYSELEAIAKQHGFSYVELGGNIGILCNGAGLTMATMDLVKLFGGDPANFLDIGGGARRERVKEAVKILLKHPKVKVLLVNIFGGITRCDEVAAGIVEALKEIGSTKPIVVRLLGTNEEEGRSILEENKIPMYNELKEAVLKAVELSKR